MRDFLSRTPFLVLCAALSIGIVLYNLTGFQFWPFCLLSVCAIGIIIVSFSLRCLDTIYRFRWLFGFGFLLLIIQIGFLVAHLRHQKLDFPFNGEKCVYNVEIIDTPIEKPRSVLCRTRLLCRSDSSQLTDLSSQAVIYFAKDTLSERLKSGDLLLISAVVSLPKPTGNPEAFDYGKYLHRQGFVGTAYVARNQWHKIGHSNKFDLLTLAGQCRMYLLDIYKKLGIEGDEFGMLAALTLGYKDALTPELRESFSTTGAMHVLAVSGLHVGIIFVVLEFLLSFLNRWRFGKRLKPILIIVLLWSYAFITGLSPSVLRSSVMFSCMAFGGVLGRKSNTYNTIFVSAFFLLFFNADLLFDVGFQLSYSAVIAIVYFQPKIAGLLYVRNRFLRWAWDLAAVSLAAQIGTAPFAIFYFHQFPNYFLLSNFVVIPAATLILYSAVFLFIVSPIPYLNVAIAFLLKWILKIMYTCIAWIENLPYALSVVWIDGWQLLLLYVIIVAATVGFVRKSFTFVTITMCALIMFGLINVYNHYTSLNMKGVIAYNDYKAVVVDVVGNDAHYVVTTDSVRARLLGEDFWNKHKIPNPQFVMLDTLQNGAFKVFGEKYLVLTQNYFRYKTTKTPLDVDYLIVNKAIYPNERLVSDFILPQKLITLADVSEYSNDKYQQIADKFGFSFFSVKRFGAWIEMKQE